MTWLAVAFVSVISLGFAVLAFVAVYGVEDAILNRQLDAALRAHAHGRRLPAGVRVVDFGMLPANLRPLREIGQRGEGRSDGRYFHYQRVARDGSAAYLLLDATDQLVVRQSFRDLLLIFGSVTIAVLGIALAAAWWLSSVALRPFEKLVRLVNDERLSEGDETIDRIRESDVRLLAEEFRRTLLEKRQAIQEQIVFNQGISHELRTPLQIIKNSLELLENDIAGMEQQPPFERLRRASRRMERMSSAFLWLTTTDTCTSVTSVAECVGVVLAELKPLLDERDIRTDLTVESDLSLRAPAPVIELMLYNLISNVARHTKHSTLSVVIASDSVALENPLMDGAVSGDGFRLGLDIVRRLADRFGLLVEHAQNTRSFRTRLASAGGEDLPATGSDHPGSNEGGSTLTNRASRRSSA